MTITFYPSISLALSLHLDFFFYWYLIFIQSSYIRSEFHHLLTTILDIPGFWKEQVGYRFYGQPMHNNNNVQIQHHIYSSGATIAIHFFHMKSPSSTMRMQYMCFWVICLWARAVLAVLLQTEICWGCQWPAVIVHLPSSDETSAASAPVNKTHILYCNAKMHLKLILQWSVLFKLVVCIIFVIVYFYIKRSSNCVSLS